MDSKLHPDSESVIILPNLNTWDSVRQFTSKFKTDTSECITVVIPMMYKGAIRTLLVRI